MNLTIECRNTFCYMHLMKYHEGIKYYVFQKPLMKKASFKILPAEGDTHTYIHIPSVSSVYISYKYFQLQIAVKTLA